MIYFDVLDADFDASDWAFHLQVHNGISIIVGERTSLLYIVMAFLHDNMCWLLVAALMIVLARLFHARITNTYRKYSPLVQVRVSVLGLRIRCQAAKELKVCIQLRISDSSCTEYQLL